MYSLRQGSFDTYIADATVTIRFMEVLQTYQSMEMKHRDKSRQRIERQYLIAKPDASPEEIRKAVEGGQEVQVFAQAVSRVLRCVRKCFRVHILTNP